MRVLVGTSGYSYKEWKGNFYPEDAKPQEMLRLYAEKLSTVEINNTFYRMPSEKVLLGWAEQVPENFSFVLKASRRITHFKRLEDVGEVLSYVLQTATALGQKLGPMLFQLPPDLAKDRPRLVDFLAQLPRKWPVALEFRHASWFDDEVYEALRARNAALVVSDGKAGARQVETGIQSETHIEIVDGLSEGDQIVIGNYRAISRDLEDGSEVQTADESEAEDSGSS